MSKKPAPNSRPKPERMPAAAPKGAKPAGVLIVIAGPKKPAKSGSKPR